MSVSVDSPEHSINPFSHLLNSISSYDGNVMLAAVISLLLVILFVLLLHVYAKWFLAQARQRSRSSSMSVSHVFRPDRFHHFHASAFETTFTSSSSKGLDSSVISSIPLFVYKMDEYKHGLECVICLSAFDDNDVGRNLPKCGHGFHVECIDMWLQSHSNCPICRTPVLDNDKVSVVISADSQVSSNPESMGELLNGEVGMIDGNSRLDNLTDLSDTDNNRQIAAANDDNRSASSSSLTTLSSSLGCSLKRMLSRNRSERKVFPSSSASELEV
ncbi:RING-H2 finger protein ATL63-like [Durio zibethinus]|uniref:RING-type E3 ubiquitin transferase n=1 Tax=Durio zibethinus TaxID=66656 RepID=A0A6P5XMQ7_DURZI|nr:RING-H2 finger protein ATL63-like [Durio zibethinus]